MNNDAATPPDATSRLVAPQLPAHVNSLSHVGSAVPLVHDQQALSRNEQQPLVQQVQLPQSYEAPQRQRWRQRQRRGRGGGNAPNCPPNRTDGGTDGAQPVSRPVSFPYVTDCVTNNILNELFFSIAPNAWKDHALFKLYFKHLAPDIYLTYVTRLHGDKYPSHPLMDYCALSEDRLRTREQNHAEFRCNADPITHGLLVGVWMFMQHHEQPLSALRTPEGRQFLAGRFRRDRCPAGAGCRESFCCFWHPHHNSNPDCLACGMAEQGLESKLQHNHDTRLPTGLQLQEADVFVEMLRHFAVRWWRMKGRPR